MNMTVATCGHIQGVVGGPGISVAHAVERYPPFHDRQARLPLRIEKNLYAIAASMLKNAKDRNGATRTATLLALTGSPKITFVDFVGALKEENRLQLWRKDLPQTLVKNPGGVVMNAGAQVEM